jgi:hypothetical protein
VRADDPFRSAAREAVHLLALADADLDRDGNSHHFILDEKTFRRLLTKAGVGALQVEQIVRAARGYRAASLDRRLRRSTCPSCGDRLIPVIHGMVGWDVGELAGYGLVEIAGCDVSDRDPSWRCTRCGCTDLDDVRSPDPETY